MKASGYIKDTTLFSVIHDAPHMVGEHFNATNLQKQNHILELKTFPEFVVRLNDV